jgi:hypothetical protein
MTMQFFMGTGAPLWIVAVAILIRFGGAGVSFVLNAYATLVEKRADREVALAALQASAEKSTPSKRTASK